MPTERSNLKYLRFRNFQTLWTEKVNWIPPLHSDSSVEVTTSIAYAFRVVVENFCDMLNKGIRVKFI